MQVEKNYSLLISPAYGTPGIRGTADRIAKSRDSMNRERRKQLEQPLIASPSEEVVVAASTTESPPPENLPLEFHVLNITV
ncbi:MAG: hypothetical protein NTV65_10575 [Proteobacteria bacterium]|nr:hypothetical protein [Pseudomonadota bacterium]